METTKKNGRLRRALVGLVNMGLCLAIPGLSGYTIGKVQELRKHERDHLSLSVSNEPDGNYGSDKRVFLEVRFGENTYQINNLEKYLAQFDPSELRSAPGQSEEEFLWGLERKAGENIVIFQSDYNGREPIDRSNASDFSISYGTLHNSLRLE